VIKKKFTVGKLTSLQVDQICDLTDSKLVCQWIAQYAQGYTPYTTHNI